jgi:hypothetical protein
MMSIFQTFSVQNNLLEDTQYQESIFESNLSYGFFRLGFDASTAAFSDPQCYRISYTVEHFLSRYKKNRELLNNTTLTLIKKKLAKTPFLFSPLNIMVADEEKTIKKQKQAERTA